MNIMSYGGGRQSAAIVCLIENGLLPKPDLIVMADTGREASTTWDYTNNIMLSVIRRLGIEFHVAPHSLAGIDLYGENGDILIPAYTTDGKLPTFCSWKWKAHVFRRYIRSLGVKSATVWFGMSLDEVDRMRISDVKWLTNHYPLIFDVPMRAHECIDYVVKSGYPLPPRSSCWMCPHRRNEEWRLLRDNAPEDFIAACDLDDEIRAKDTRGGVWLHETRKPLRDVDLDTPEPQTGQLDLCANYCWT
jgi:hypothetical protein